MTIYQNLIAGEWVGSQASQNLSPSDTNDVVGLYAQANADDAKQAVAAAKAAFPAWSRSGILERHAILRKASDEILARKEELGALLAREEGKVLPEAIGEVTRAAQIFDFFAGEALRLAGETVPSARTSARQRRLASVSSEPGSTSPASMRLEKGTRGSARLPATARSACSSSGSTASMRACAWRM